MLKNYLKTSIRNLLKNPLSAFINVFGLALAIGTCMITYAYLSMEFNMEQHHKKKDRIFMLTSQVDRDGEADLYGMSPAPIGLKLMQDFSQIEGMTRVWDRSVIVKRGANVFEDHVRMVDPSYLEMFDFDIIKGEKEALRDPNAVFMNEKTVKKYFGDQNPIGETVQMRFTGGRKALLTVAGIVHFEPMTTSLDFTFLGNFNLLETVDEKFQSSDWSKNIRATFIQVADPAEVNFIAEQMDDYRELVNSAQPDWQIQEFSFEPLTTLYDRSNEIRWDISRESDREGHVILSIIGLMMLVLACLNYLNIAVASATKRLKEIGVRKVVGASRSRLVLQFLVENMLLSAIALVTGFLIAKLFFLPGLNSLFAVEIPIKVLDIRFFAYLIGLLIFTALASGAYPALYISKFQAVSIFRGRLRFGKKNLLTKIFLTVQFILAVVTVVCGITFTLNTEWQSARPWGYNKDETLVLEVPDHETYETMRAQLEQMPNIQAISGGVHHLGHYLSSSIIQLPERKIEAYRLDVAANYVQTMELQLKEGEDFKEDYESDKTKVLINETFAKQLGWADPIGKSFRFDSTSYSVKGVLEDFHYYSFWSDIYPVFVRVAQEDFDYAAIRGQKETLIGTFEEVEQTWLSTFPELPFEGDYQIQLSEEYFRSINGHKVLMISVALIALLLSCFGLYGLVSLNVAGRIKEFSIRKVLGARLVSLAKSVSAHFLLFLLAALLLGAPISYFLIGLLLDTIYTYHMEMTFFPVILAVGLIAMTVLITISSHISKIEKANPTEGLRME